MWVRSGVTINLKNVIQMGLASRLGKTLAGVMPLEQMYGMAGAKGKT